MIRKQKNNGKYLVRIYYTDRGKRQSVSKTFPTIAAAKAWSLAMEVRKAEGKLTRQSDITFPEYFKQWYETYKESVLAPETKRVYKSAYNTLEKEFSGILLSDMTRMRYQKFINDFSAKRSVETVNRLSYQVSSSIKDAVEDGFVEKDFTNRITKGGLEGADPETKFLNEKDALNLMAYLENSQSVTSTAPAMMYTALYTGMRLAEVKGLTEEYFFPKFKRIQIARTLDTKLEFKPTKNKSSERIIDIPQNLVDYLTRMIQLQHDENPVDNPKKLIFMNKYGQVPTSEALSKDLERLLNKIGSDKIITFHGLRHTHASYLLAHDVKLDYVSKRLGHKNVDVTLKVYHHLLKETEKQEADKAVNLFETIAERTDTKAIK